MKEQKIAVIGFGMWGKNIVRNFYNLNVLDIVCDLDEEVHKTIKEQFPGVKVTKDLNDIINDETKVLSTLLGGYMTFTNSYSSGEVHYGSNSTTKTDWLILFSIMAVSVFAWILTYDGILSFFALSGTLIYTYSVWQSNAKLYNILAIIGSIQWIVYYLFIFSIFGIILECVLLVTETVGTIRYFRQDKKNKVDHITIK